MTTRKKAIYTLFVVMMASFLMLSLFYYIGWLRPIHFNNKATSIKVRRNSSVYQVSQEMQRRRWVWSSHFVRWVAEWKGYRHLKFGEYIVEPGMTIAQIIQNMASSQGLVSHQITFIEGTTFKDFILRLQQNQNITHTLKMPLITMARQIGLADQKPEGLFFPDTYHFSWGTTDVAILKMAYHKMQLYLQNAWLTRSPGLPYKNSYQALIVASLIQSEVRLERERPLVSSVIINRLHKRMRLQIDPTVMYGLDLPFGSRLRRSDLKKMTPYNTYLNYGLPPTPIDMPGSQSIEAALHPAKTDYFYYVASGHLAHQFSVNYRDHRQAVVSYWQGRSMVTALNQRENKRFRRVLLSQYAPLLFWFFCFG